MASAITLAVSPRKAAGKKSKYLRQQGRVPGVLYGYNVENQPVECTEQEFHKVFVKAGESTVVELALGGKTVPVLIHELVLDPVTGRYAHIDFLALDMTKEVTAHVPLRTVGEAPGVKDLGGVLMHNRTTLTVKCLPKNLPHSLEVDISSLKNFHDAITVAVLTVPSGVKIEEKAEEIVVSLQPPRKEEEKAPAAAEGAIAEGAAPVEGAVEGAAPAAEGAPKEQAEVKQEKGKQEKDKKGGK